MKVTIVFKTKHFKDRYYFDEINYIESETPRDAMLEDIQALIDRYKGSSGTEGKE